MSSTGRPGSVPIDDQPERLRPEDALDLAGRNEACAGNGGDHGGAGPRRFQREPCRPDRGDIVRRPI